MNNFLRISITHPTLLFTHSKWLMKTWIGVGVTNLHWWIPVIIRVRNPGPKQTEYTRVHMRACVRAYRARPVRTIALELSLCVRCTKRGQHGQNRTANACVRACVRVQYALICGAVNVMHTPNTVDVCCAADVHFGAYSTDRISPDTELWNFPALTNNKIHVPLGRPFGWHWSRNLHILR